MTRWLRPVSATVASTSLAPWLPPLLALVLGVGKHQVAARVFEVPGSLYIRYYGERTGVFQDARNFPLDVCNSLMAMCEVIHVGECKKTADEFAAPYSHWGDDNHLRWEAGGKGVGYMTLAVDDYSATARLSSECDPMCISCNRTLVGIDLAGGVGICASTSQQAVYMAVPGTMSGTEEMCVDSLDEYYDLLAQREARYRLIVTAAGGLLLVLVCTFCGVSIFLRPKPPPPLKAISAEEIERVFPACRGSLPRRSASAAGQGTSAVATTASGGGCSRGGGEDEAGTGRGLSDSAVDGLTAGTPGPAHGDDLDDATSSNGELPTCIVCLASIEPGELFRRLQCAHCFHADCILEWWTHVPRAALECPTCRQLQRVDSTAPEAGSGPLHTGAGSGPPSTVAAAAAAAAAAAGQL